MRAMRNWMVAGLVGMLAAGGCGRGEPAGGEAGTPSKHPPGSVRGVPEPPLPPLPMTAADSARARARLASELDSLTAAFSLVRPLGAREVAELRQDLNAEQVAAARRLGLRVSGEAGIEQLRRQGRLVPLEDSTAYWVLREMEHSVPYVTPDARSALELLGRRFHARLDSLGLPRFRVKVTSALRTDDDQARLRKTNSYASRTVSAHEFGTTVDVSHERFAVPAGPEAGSMEADMLEELGKEHARALQAELGRAIGGMRDQGLLHVMMENRQPVYHITIARPVPPAG